MPRLVMRGVLLLGLSTNATLMTTLAGDAEARAAGRASQLSGTSVVSPGGRAVIKLTLHLPADECLLQARSGQHWQTLSAVNPERAHLEWSWRVPAGARAATWHLQASCETERWSSTLRVRGRSHHSSARQLVAGWVRVRQSGAALPAPDSSSEGEPAPASEPAPSPPSRVPPNGNAIFTLEGGNCTDWGYYKRPDIYNDQSPTDPLADNWDAWTWAEHARLEGLTVNETPEVGAIADWPISSSSPFGHVAFVEAVSPEAPGGETVSITEMNSGSGQTAYLLVGGVEYPYEYETVTVSSLTALGVVFIHQR